MSNKKLVRVLLEWSDGTIEVAVNEEAEKWNEASKTAGIVASVHGINFPEVKWERIKKDE